MYSCFWYVCMYVCMYIRLKQLTLYKLEKCINFCASFSAVNICTVTYSRHNGSKILQFFLCEFWVTGYFCCLSSVTNNSLPISHCQYFFLSVCGPMSGSEVVRIAPVHFLARYCETRLNHGFVVLCDELRQVFLFLCFLCVWGAHVISFLCFRLSVPLQLITWKGSSPTWPIMCQVGHTT